MGRPQFSSPGTKGGTGETIATNDVPALISPELAKSANVAAGGSEAVTFAPGSGAVWTLLQFDFTTNGDADQTVGQHSFLMMLDTAVELLEGASTFGTQLVWRQSTWQSADASQSPSTEAAQNQVIRGLVVTNGTPLRMEYHNDTDAAQEPTREYSTQFRVDTL